MLVFDASSALYAWDNYPIEQFPPLWAWLALRIAKGQLTISAVARRGRTQISRLRVVA